jgi:hypothetical protein
VYPCYMLNHVYRTDEGSRTLMTLESWRFKCHVSACSTTSVLLCGRPETRTPERFTVSRFQGGVLNQPGAFHRETSNLSSLLSLTLFQLCNRACILVQFHYDSELCDSTQGTRVLDRLLLLRRSLSEIQVCECELSCSNSAVQL